MFPSRLLFAQLLAAAAIVAAEASSAWAGFFSPAASTIAQEIESSHVVVIATLRDLPADPGPEIPGVEREFPRAKFEIERVLKGEKLASPEQRIEVDFLGDGKPGDRFLVTGTLGPPLEWSSPVPMNVRSEAYVSQLS